MSVAKGIEKQIINPVRGDIDEKREEKSEKRKARNETERMVYEVGLLIGEENIIFQNKFQRFEPPHNLCNGQYIALTIFHDSV